MKILFLNLPYKFQLSRTSRWPEKTKSGTLYYPYWLCYAAGVCMQKGHKVELIDCIARKMTVQDTIKAVMEIQPDYIMGEITTSSVYYDYKVLAAIKAKYPKGKIVIGGTHATALSEQVLKECNAIDVVVRQEYDFTLPEIMEAGGELRDVAGITWRDGADIIYNADRPWTEDLDSLPFVSKVYRKFLNVNDYFYAFARKPMIQIFSSRGCPHRCNFCSYPETMSGRCVRKRSVENFVDEIEYICKKMPEIQEIFIEDDTFTVDRKRVIAICKEIIKRDIHPIWSCNTRADLPYEVMKQMKAAGCRLLVVGYESGNQDVLNQTLKGIKLEQSYAFAKNTKKLGLKVFGCFMIGLKGDSLERIEETFRFAKRLYPDMVFFQQAVPFPGTGFYQWVKEEGYLKTEDYSKWLNKEGYLDCLVDYPYATAKEIEKLRDRLMSRYYFSFTYIVKTFLRNLTWQEFKRVTKAGFTYIGFRIKKLFY